ncbi:MAG: phosphoglycerate mutase family protein [Lachnospiraceae bacterium]|nr:phosphoglycerate mutase family protein [Lachnospiraceae bacterium]
MLLYLIRHGATKGNIEKRYVGSTDETLTREAVERLVEWRHRYSEQLSQVQMVVVSPMKRCRQTADILFPGMRQYVVQDFQECDFGAFEYRNFRELDGNAAYQRFIDSCGECGFPGGENREVFQSRCVDGFEKLLSGHREAHIALVVHGGTIMALLDRYSFPHRDYYDWQTDNGTGFIIEADRDLETGEWKFNVIGTLDKVR